MTGEKQKIYFKKKVHKFIPSDPVTPLLAIYPKEVILKQKKKIIQRMLTAVYPQKQKIKIKINVNKSKNSNAQYKGIYEMGYIQCNP